MRARNSRLVFAGLLLGCPGAGVGETSMGSAMSGPGSTAAMFAANPAWDGVAIHDHEAWSTLPD